MKTDRYTPNEWQIIEAHKGALIISSSTVHIAEIITFVGGGAYTEEQRANAQLIKTAPKLLQGLRNALAVILALSDDNDTRLIKELESIIKEATNQ